MESRDPDLSRLIIFWRRRTGDREAQPHSELLLQPHCRQWCDFCSLPVSEVQGSANSHPLAQSVFLLSHFPLEFFCYSFEDNQFFLIWFLLQTAFVLTVFPLAGVSLTTSSKWGSPDILWLYSVSFFHIRSPYIYSWVCLLINCLWPPVDFKLHEGRASPVYIQNLAENLAHSTTQEYISNGWSFCHYMITVPMLSVSISGIWTPGKQSHLTHPTRCSTQLLKCRLNKYWSHMGY